MKAALLFAALLFPTLANGDPRKLLQEGLFEEEANRNLEKATAAYESVIESFDKDRQYAATAIFRLGEIRAKQNRKEEAIALFQRILAEFTNVDPLARLSRERIASLGGNAPALAIASSPTSDRESQELSRLQDLVKNSPDLLNAGKETPLEQAAKEGWLKAATFLIENGAEINGRPNGFSPLHWAANSGRKAMVELLLARGAEVDRLNHYGETPLQVAVEGGRTEVARVLIDRGANPAGVIPDKANRNRPPLHVASGSGNVGMVRLLLEENIDVNLNIAPEPDGKSSGNFFPGTALMAAVQSRNIDVVKLLLDHRADPNIQMDFSGGKMTALRAAVRMRSIDMAKLLLDRGADPNPGVPIFDAVDAQDGDMVRLLASKGANLDAPIPLSGGKTSLHAVVTRFTDMTKLLLELGASPKVTDDEKLTPLHEALSYFPTANQQGFPGTIPGLGPEQKPPVIDPLEIFKLLIKHGANINAQTAYGYAPLHTAVFSRVPPFEVLDWLLANGADAKIKTNEGHTASMLASVPIGLWLDARTTFPALAKERAIHGRFRIKGASLKGETRIDPLAEFDTPPNVRDVAAKILETEKANPRIPSELDMIVYRKLTEFESKEVSRQVIQRMANTFDYGNPNELPDLEWGDVVVLCSRDPLLQSNTHLPSKSASSKPAIRKVTIRVGDREAVLGLMGDLSYNQGWDPSTGQIPEFRLSELVKNITQGESRVRLEAIKVQRTQQRKRSDGGIVHVSELRPPKEWTVDLRSDQPGKVKELPARLADGDRVIVELNPADSPEALKNRRSGIFRITNDQLFGECVFRFHEKDNAPRTLCELIAEVYRNSPMVIVDPDLAKIRIRRLKPTDDSEEVLIVNLATIAGNVTAKSTREEVQRLDFPLQWGDIVDIAPTKRDNPAVWMEFDDQFKLFLSKALARSVQVTGSESQVFVEFRPSYGSFVAMMSPMNHFVGRQGSPGSEFRAFGKSAKPGIKLGGNVAKVRLESGNSVREFSSQEFTAVNPWLKDGDRIEIVRF